MTTLKAASVKVGLARAQAYGLLARAFGQPDARFESDVEGGGFQQALREALDALSYADVIAAAAPLAGPGVCNGLGSDFVRLFNPSVDANCSPYETEYTGAHVFMRVQRLADVAGFYRAFGLRVAAAFHERPDHIAAELEFMQVLALKEARALARGERGNAGVCRRAQVRFLKEHLGRWLAPYAQRLSNQAQGTFYARLALLARDFVARDAQRLGVTPEHAAPSPAPGPEPELSCPMSGGEADVPR